jgi:hypothetical protein
MADQMHGLFQTIKDLVFLVQKPKAIEADEEARPQETPKDDSQILFINNACAKKFGVEKVDLDPNQPHVKLQSRVMNAPIFEIVSMVPDKKIIDFQSWINQESS